MIDYHLLTLFVVPTPLVSLTVITFELLSILWRNFPREFPAFSFSSNIYQIFMGNSKISIAMATNSWQVVKFWRKKNVWNWL